MKSKNFFLLTFLLTGVLILSACAPAASPEEPQESAPPEEVPYPYPASDENEDETVLPEEPTQPYPEPQEAIADDATAGDDAMSNDPYPGIEVVSGASNQDMSEALTSADFVVLSTDKELLSGPVYIDRSEIVLKESFPVQVELVLIGNLPTPCNQLRVIVGEPDENGYIEVEAYTVSDPNRMCAQMLQPFVAVISLGEYTEGTYNVSINHEMNGEFSLP